MKEFGRWGGRNSPQELLRKVTKSRLAKSPNSIIDLKKRVRSSAPQFIVDLICKKKANQLVGTLIES